MLEALTGQTLGVFIGLTLVLTGAAAMSMGRALARTWRPVWQIVPYALLLGATNRFLSYALFQEPLLHLVGFLVISVILVLLALFAYRIARTNKMVAQYPWLYERATPFSLRARPGM
jgi:GR25 family glycosyltransferase involved in LPS biosynthesis